MNLQVWLASSLVQLFPGTAPGTARSLSIHAALNERMAFTVGIHARDKHEKAALQVKTPRGWSVRIRRVGYVPLWHRNGIRNLEGDGHLPGLYPDPLLDESQSLVTRGETMAFLVTLQPGRSAQPGRQELAVSVSGETGKPTTLRVAVQLYPLRIKPRRDFLVTNWFTADALFNWYGCRGFDEKFWGIVPAYFRNMAEHGQDMVSTPLLHWSTRRPTQLLRVRRGAGQRYEFDFSLVERWVHLARAGGIRAFEWMDLLTWWNAAFIARVYEGDPEDRKLLWRTKPDPTTPHYKKYAGQVGIVDCPDATGPESREFFAQLLPRLHRFLSAEKLLDYSWFHLGDEPEKENLHNYQASAAMLRQMAPWMKLTDPYCWMEYVQPGLIDLPFPRTAMVPAILERGLDTAAYYCGNPGNTHINRLMDTPLPQVRMNGWAFYRFQIKGFLHWAYNFWFRWQGNAFVAADPFANFDSFPWPHHAYGDCWSVYPGPAGPIDTLRWEAFADSLQDYALLQTLGVPRDDRPLRAIESFDRFPIDENWIHRVRRHYLDQSLKTRS